MGEILHESEWVMRMSDHARFLGSREAGQALRVKVANLLKADPGCKLVIDFSEVPVISSGVADELFGMLFADLGPMVFMSRIELRNVDSTIRGLIDKAIVKRLHQRTEGK
ncbi:MAG: STAS-like domain-containing protein [Magnetococcales bacterium]|nr:STAS-like domain-containing protein [Magnetococcales bacterium]